MKRNLLLEYSEELTVKIIKLCAKYKIDSNTIFQIKKSSSSVFANITEAQYSQSLADMNSKLEIARKECAETESWRIIRPRRLAREFPWGRRAGRLEHVYTEAYRHMRKARSLSTPRFLVRICGTVDIL